MVGDFYSPAWLTVCSIQRGPSHTGKVGLAEGIEEWQKSVWHVPGPRFFSRTGNKTPQSNKTKLARLLSFGG